MEVNANMMRPKQNFSINHTNKLDSFMKESQRLNPAHLSMFVSILPSPWQP
jgi:hypothetical protein